MMQLRLKSLNILSIPFKKNLFSPSVSLITQLKPPQFSTNPQTPQTPPKTSFLNSKFFQKYFGPDTYRALPSFKNRWLMVLPAFLTHLCIGSPWAWSVIVGKS